MSVAVDNVMATAREASGLTSDSVSFTVGSGSNRYLLVGISGWDNSSNVSGITITYNGVSVPRITGGLIPSGDNNVAFWGLAAPATGANTLALSNIPSGYAELAWAAISFTGVDQTTPVSAIVTDTADPFSVNVTLASGDLAVDTLYGGANTPTVGAGQTERSSLQYQSVKWFKMSTEGGSGSVAMSWTTGSADAALAAIAILQSSGTAYTITASGGSYTITGTTASLEFNRKLAANSGTYTITGTTASLEQGFKLSAETGAYNISGTDASLEKHKKVITDTGTYTISGTDASLEFNQKLSAESGSYAILGTDASLEYGIKITADSGTYNISGTDASLEFNRKLISDAGTYVITGADATLQYGSETTLTAEAGLYTISGTAASLEFNKLLSAESGTYSITGTDASLEYGIRLAADSGTYAITGTDANLEQHRNIIAGAGSYIITGTNVILSYTPVSTGASPYWRRYNNVTERISIDWSIGFNELYHSLQEQKEQIVTENKKIQKQVKKTNNQDLIKIIDENEKQIVYLSKLISELVALIKNAKTLNVTKFDIKKKQVLPELPNEALLFVKKERERLQKKREKMKKLITILIAMDRI